MSRVGKYPVVVPSGVTVTIAGTEVSVKGKLGASVLSLVDDVEASLEGDKLWVKPKSESKRARMMWGTTRALLNNMVKGVSEGFVKKLEIQGVGFKAAVQGKNVNLSLGYSHPINYPIPDQIKVTVEENTKLTIEGPSKEVVGRVAAEIRSYYPPEPYKGKGVRYQNEKVVRKEGKTVQ